MIKMRLLWVCIILCAVVFSNIDARYASKGHQERGLRSYHNRHQERGLRTSSHNGHHKDAYAIINSDPWLSSGKCGPMNHLPDGSPAKCNPNGEYSCCNPTSGWCGKTPEHCDCPECTDYRKGNDGIEPEVMEVVRSIHVVQFISDTTATPHLQTVKAYSAAQVTLFDTARTAGERLKQTYQDAEEGLPSLQVQVLDSLKQFGILVVDGAKYMCNKLTQITDEVHSSAIIMKLKEKLEQEDEQVAEFLQIIGHKMEIWFLSHTNFTQYSNVFQDAEIQAELQLLVENGTVTAKDVNVLVIFGKISAKIGKQVERGDQTVIDLNQLISQKTARWYEENGGSSLQLTQQVPSFFQEEDVQGKLNVLVEKGILSGSEVKTLIESYSLTMSKIKEIVENDERAKKIVFLKYEKGQKVEYQQDQHNVEILPDIFQDEEVQDYLQNLVDTGTLTQDDISIITQHQSQKRHINIKEYSAEVNPAMRRRQMRSWLNSLHY